MEKLISRNKKDREGYSSPVMTISFPFRSVLEKRLFGRNVSFLTNLRIERISLVRVYMDKLVVNAPSCVKVSRADRKVETCPRDRRLLRLTSNFPFDVPSLFHPSHFVFAF